MLEWNQKLSVGVESIDLQHRYLLDLINRLSIELEGHDSAYQARLIDELGSYARQHFTAEENFMYKLGYPGLEDHCKIHQDLLEKLHGQIGLYLMDMLDAEEIVKYVSAWAVRHVLTDDKKFGEFATKAKS